VQITATIDGHSMTITEASLRRYLKLDDHDGITSIPNSEIFEQLALMGYHTDRINKPASTTHKIHPVPSPLKHGRCLNNMKRLQRHFSGQEVALFPTMLDVTAPSTSPSRITSSPSPTPKHINLLINCANAPTQPSPTQPSPTQPSPRAEHHLPTPNESPIHVVHSHGSDEALLSQAHTRVKKQEWLKFKIGKARRRARIIKKAVKKGSAEVSTAGAKQGTASEEVPIVSTAESKGPQIARDEEIASQWDEEERQRAMAEAKTSKKKIGKSFSHKYHTLKMKQRQLPKARKNVIKYLKKQGNHKLSDFKGMGDVRNKSSQDIILHSMEKELKYSEGSKQLTLEISMHGDYYGMLAKDKVKAKMVEPEKPLKKKDQIAFDEEVARNLAAQLQAELEEKKSIHSRQKKKKPT
ncbi:hypothetical protein Tco_0644151, partial [Tanacetum coccineum]